MILEAFTGLVISIFVLACVLIIYARWDYGKLESLGIPVLKPTFCLGSVPDLHETVVHDEDMKRFEEFGPVWGVYQGRSPVVFVCDPDLIREIFVKDTDHFYDRNAIDFGEPHLRQLLDFLPGEKWKTMRAAQTRLFSLSRIKQMSKTTFTSCAQDFVKHLSSQFGTSGQGQGQSRNRIRINTKEQFLKFSMDIIFRSAFSKKLADLRNADEFMNAWKVYVGEDQVYTKLYSLSLAFPHLLAKFYPTHYLSPSVIKTYWEIINAKIKEAQSDGDDGGPNEKMISLDEIVLQNLPNLDTPKFKKLGITKVTLIAQIINFFIAGFDRTSTTLTLFAYFMAQNPEMQAKVHEELNAVIGGKYNGRIDHETVAELQYLTACVSETLRIAPVLSRSERVCTKDWNSQLKPGFKIRKGIVVMIPTWPVNRHPDYYAAPNEFRPERFLPNNKASLNPYTFATFGFGHRNCIGTKFAYESLLIGLAHVLQDFRFELRTDTQLKFKRGVLMFIQYDPVYLDLVKIR